ncbi:MAG TPA: DUF2157 domain-containing protein [Candidatus Didemnitutus sp.]|nr:DUF2157 domain-containing protein [Candidatus Didemnitutus sp.]
MKAEEKLAEWSASWARDGLVTEAQRAAILSRHPVPAGGANRFLAILASIGGALFVVGVSLVIKSNWDHLGDWVKIGGLVGLMVGLYALGWRLKISPGNYPKTGDACLMAGAVCFLLGIALVSQIFHIDSRPPNGVLLWWAGIAALPWLTQAKGVQFLSVVAGSTWLSLELATRDSWLRLAPTPGYWRNGEYASASVAFLVGTALLFFGFGLRSGKRAYFAGLHEKIGLLGVCVALYIHGFGWSVHHWGYDSVEAARWQPTVVLVMLAAAGAAWAAAKNFADLKTIAWCLALGLPSALAHLLGWDLGDSRWLWGGLACVALFVLNIGMIRAGLATGRESWINLGIGFIALNVLTRYFDLFGTMLEGGVFFIVTGLLVLGLGFYLERKRRALVKNIRKEMAA